MALEAFKAELVELVTQIKNAGGDFIKAPPLFKWSYEEHPDVEFQMLIVAKEKKEEPSKIILTS